MKDRLVREASQEKIDLAMKVFASRYSVPNPWVLNLKGQPKISNDGYGPQRQAHRTCSDLLIIVGRYSYIG